MSSTWMPRAAMSVAHSTFTPPAVNASRFRSRAFCERLPCRSTAGMPAAVSCLASFFAACFVRVNSSPRPLPGRELAHGAALSAVWSTASTWWVIARRGGARRSTECVSGFDR